MNILLVGAGTETSKLALALTEHKHVIQAQLANLAPNQLDFFDFKLIIVVTPEATVTTETLVRAVENGKVIFLVAGAADGLAAWGAATGTKTFSYPLSGVDLDSLLSEVQRTDSDTFAGDDHYRKVVLGGDVAARIQGQMNVRKIVVTSPKGGTGKTTVAVNLAVALALSGVTTYLVDADANAGALIFHLRLRKMKQTLIGLLRVMADKPPSTNADAMTAAAAAGTYLSAFTTLDDLPTLKVLTGMATDDLGDKALQNEDVINNTIRGLFEAGVASGGVVIMDVGINPSHPVHRAALRNAEAIAIVIKPEVPDLAETNRWIGRMITSLASSTGKASAMEFIGSRVKVCYNMVVSDEFKKAHKMLLDSLKDENLEINLVPNGILPSVDSRIAAHAVNSDSRQDILVWRYKNERLEDLQAFVEALLSFASHFVPAVNEGAARVGLVPGKKKKKGILGW